MKHHDSENCDRKQARPSRNRVIDSRSDADAILRDRIHDCGRERRDAYRHACPKDDNSRKKLLPVAPSHTGYHEKREAKGYNQRTYNERNFRAVTLNEPARPARKQKDDQDKWQKSRTRCGGRVMLNLD